MTRITFTAQQLDERAQVWAAFSNLFLDTDASLLHRYVGEQLRASRYSNKELFDILHDEVGPAFYPNLLSIAGEWAGYRQEDAKRIVLAYLNAPAPFRWIRRALGASIVARVIKDHWRAIMISKWSDVESES